MSQVLAVLVIVVIVAVVLLLIVAVSGLVVWAASGVGWVLINWLHLPFSPFEATLLCLVSLFAVMWIAGRLLGDALTTLPTSISRGRPKPQEEGDEDDEGDEDWDDDEYEDEEDEEEEREPEQVSHVPSIPKWRQPIRRASDGLPIVAPDDRCPCGSGRKYKNCHGRKK